MIIVQVFHLSFLQLSFLGRVCANGNQHYDNEQCRCRQNDSEDYVIHHPSHAVVKKCNQSFPHNFTPFVPRAICAGIVYRMKVTLKL